MSDSRDIGDLQPPAAAKARACVAAWTAAGLDPVITTTLRSLAESARLYAQGRTAPGKVVTNAKAGQSLHNWGVAWDAYPRINGEIAWGYDDTPAHKAAWDRMGAIATGLGVEWGRIWHAIKDTPHWQFTGGHDLAFFQHGGKL